MEEKKVTFEEKLTQLLELAKTKKNVLDNKEILNYFHGEILSPEQLDQIYDFLENHHVDVLRMDDDEDMEPELFEDGEEEEPIDVDNLDLSIVHAILIEHAGNASVYVRICTDDAVLGGQGFFNGFLAVCTVHTLDPHDLGRGTRCNRFLGKIFAARTSIPIAAAGTAASTGASAASAAFSRVMTDRRT